MFCETDYTVAPDVVPLAKLPDLPTAEFVSVLEEEPFAPDENFLLEEIFKPRRTDNLAAELTFLFSNMFLEIDVVVC